MALPFPISAYFARCLLAVSLAYRVGHDWTPTKKKGRRVSDAGKTVHYHDPFASIPSSPSLRFQIFSASKIFPGVPFGALRESGGDPTRPLTTFISPAFVGKWHRPPNAPPRKKRDRAKRKISRHMGKQVKQMKWTIYFLLRRVRFMQHSFGVHIAATHVFELALDIKTCDEAQLENPLHVDAETKKGNERQLRWMWPAIPADQHDCIYKVKAGKKSWDELGNQTCPTYREAS